METQDQRIFIFDTTLRDGEQSPGASMNIHEKLLFARQLERLGVDIIEAGFPVASEGDFASVQQIAREIRGVQVAALARANTADIDRAWQSVQDAAHPRIHTFISSSDIWGYLFLNFCKNSGNFLGNHFLSNFSTISFCFSTVEPWV